MAYPVEILADAHSVDFTYTRVLKVPGMHYGKISSVVSISLRYFLLNIIKHNKLMNIDINIYVHKIFISQKY